MELDIKRGVVVLSSKGQLTLPTRFRKDLKVDTGDYLAIYEVGTKVLILEKIRPTPLDKITRRLSRAVDKSGITAENIAESIKKARKKLWDVLYKEKN